MPGTPRCDRPSGLRASLKRWTSPLNCPSWPSHAPPPRHGRAAPTAHQDAVSALMTLGLIDDAERTTDQLEVSARTNHHPWSVVMALRCRGLLTAATGDLSGAAALLEQALTHHVDLPMPFEEGRTRLIFGRVLRRSRHRNDARREFEVAHAIFLGPGAPVHLSQSGPELRGPGGRRGGHDARTPVEQRIVALVSAGHTNKEVAGALFLSVRTVEGHLGHVYRKLDVRSRTELARRTPQQTAPAAGLPDPAAQSSTGTSTQPPIVCPLLWSADGLSTSERRRIGPDLSGGEVPFTGSEGDLVRIGHQAGRHLRNFRSRCAEPAGSATTRRGHLLLPVPGTVPDSGQHCERCSGLSVRPHH